MGRMSPRDLLFLIFGAVLAFAGTGRILAANASGLARWWQHFTDPVPREAVERFSDYDGEERAR